MIIASLDPGKHLCGWAVFAPGLVACGYSPFGLVSGIIAEHVDKVDRLYVELPFIRPQRRAKGSPNDLIPLAFNAGLVSGELGCPTFKVLPHEWKGNIKKTKLLENYIVHRRIKAALGVEELGIYETALAEVSKDLRHNIADAVGVGCHALGIRIRRTSVQAQGKKER